MTQVRAFRRSFLASVAALVLTAGVVLTGTSASAAPAVGTVFGSATPDALPGQYLVRLKDNSTVRSRGVSSVARDLAERHDGTLGFTYRSAVRGFSVRMSEQHARELAADPAVAVVEQDQLVRIADTQSNPPSWGLDRVDQRALPLDNSYTFDTTASDVHAYVIDTGVRTTHTTFGGRATSGFDAIDGGAANDGNGHGTHVAGTIGGSEYGIAKEVQIVAVRVLNNAGSGTIAQVVAGIDWVTANAIKPAVANMSLGGGANTTLDNAVARSIQSGVSYAIAAGNGDLFGNPVNACTQSPARVPEAITVGATQDNDARASFSNTGTCLDLFAPGVDITSAWRTGDTATNTISGTSMATPHVAGAAALILADDPAAPPQQVRDTLVANATPGVVGDPRAGSPNLLLFTNPSSEPQEPPTGGACTGTNGDNVQIPDAGAAVTSAITISGCDRSASATSQVEVHINHTYRGDLQIDLVAPDGSAYRVKNADLFDGSANVNSTFTGNLSGEAGNGTWRLRVQDMFSQDTGFIDSWTLRL